LAALERYKTTFPAAMDQRMRDILEKYLLLISTSKLKALHARVRARCKRKDKKILAATSNSSSESIFNI
jgi:hypothetical protein